MYSLCLYTPTKPVCRGTFYPDNQTMIMRFCTFFLLFIILLKEFYDETKAINKVGDLPTLRVLPGRGFDSLSNVDMKHISEIKTKHSHKTPDERFLIPSGYIVSLKQDFEIKVDIFAHYSEFFAVTAPTLNAIKWVNIMNDEETTAQIDGSFSKRYHKVKRLYLDNHLSTIRTTARFTLYKVFMYKDHRLETELLDQVRKMMDEILNDNFVGAIQMADKIVRDYGTRHISSIDVGGLFVREEFMNRSFVLLNRDVLPSHAIHSFLEFVNGDWPEMLGEGFKKMKWKMEDKKTYKLNRDSTNTYMFGGMRVMNLKKWMSTVRDNLAIIDRDGEDLHKAILQTSSFLDYSPEIVAMVAKLLKYSVDKYYRVNSHRGCLRIHSPLVYDGTVNLPVRKWCEKYFQTFFLGGFYQNCTVLDKFTRDICGDYNFANVVTGSPNCPLGHTDALIFRKSVNYTCPSTFNDSFPCSAEVETHWCSTTDSNNNSSYRFGGVYSTYVTNFLTGSRSCPTFFYPMPILGIYICTSYQFLNKIEHVDNFHFGGLVAICSNEQLSSVPTCPIGYTSHFATFYESCEVYYCAQFGAKALHFEVQLLRPPAYVEEVEKNKKNVD